MHVPSRIRIKGQYVPVINAAVFQRHQIKSNRSKTGLTQRGLAAARKGMSYPAGFKLKTYHSGVSRTISTADTSLTSAKRMRMHTGNHSLYRKELHYRMLEGTTELDRRSELLSNPQAQHRFLKAWIRSQIEPGLVGDSQRIAHRIIRKRLGPLSAASRKGVTHFVTLNVTHGWIPELIFHYLTGKTFNQKRKGITREGEAMQLLWIKGGRIFLQYRNKRFDVTKQLNTILSHTVS